MLTMLLLWFVLLPLALALAFLLGVAMLVGLGSAWRQFATSIHTACTWLIRRGVPLDYAVPVGLALLPVAFVIIALLLA